MLLDWSITASWIAMLTGSTLAMFMIPLALNTKRHLLTNQYLLWVAAILLSACDLIFTFGITFFNTLIWSLLTSACMGALGAFLWIAWGEYYTSLRVSYRISQIAPTVGIIILSSIILTLLLPYPVNSIFSASLPLLSVWLLTSVLRRAGELHYPQLLPKLERIKGGQNALVVCMITAGASSACYFTVAIIPYEDLPWETYLFSIGILAAGVVLILIGFICRLMPSRINIFRIYPWLLAFTEFAVLLYLGQDSFHYPLSFLIALILSSIFEVLLLMYIGILATKGYLTPSLAFGFCGGFIHAGILVGNSTAIIFEQFPWLQEMFLIPTSLIFASATVFMLIPLVRREYLVAELTAPISSLTDIEQQVDAVAEEFALSKREREILGWVVRGYTAEGIGKTLCISGFTVQTHIQHIYAKTGIHKKSELIDYVAKRDISEPSSQDSESIDSLPTYWPLPS